MEGIKCGLCRLVNNPSEITCRRCGHLVGIARSDKVRDPHEAGRGASLIYTILALSLIGSAVAYVFFGLEKSYNKIEMDEMHRIGKEPRTLPSDQTRSQFEKQQTEHYGTAIQNSNGLAQSQKHVNEVEKMMAPSKERPAK